MAVHRSDGSILGSVTYLIQHLPNGDEEALQKLYAFFLWRLVHMAAERLKRFNRRVADEEDVAQEVLLEFLRDGLAGKLPRLASRQDALRMLAARVSMRAVNQQRRLQAQKRGGGKVGGESMLGPAATDTQRPGMDQLADSAATPEEEVMEREFLEELQRILGADLFPYADAILQGYTVPETAIRLGVSKATAYRKLKIIGEQLERIERFQQLMVARLNTD